MKLVQLATNMAAASNGISFKIFMFVPPKGAGATEWYDGLVSFALWLKFGQFVKFQG
jgi:hypothetical protein